jgi:outer membrane protein OmpA-like peptidoglycan-associated protein
MREAKMSKARISMAGVMIVALLDGCATHPPKPPEVDESGRRPANQQSAVDLQVCKVELAEARGLIVETRRLAESSSAALAQVVVGRFQPVSDLKAEGAAAAPGGVGPAAANVVWTLRFAYNSAVIEAAPDELQRMIDASKTAAYVVVKGRTDGSVETSGESRIAQRRMEVMYDVLLKGGVDGHKIALQYQAVGDRIADNSTQEGRAANRRVEVELYPVVPERIVVNHGQTVTAAATTM